MANIVYKAEGTGPCLNRTARHEKVDINVIKTDMEAYNKLKTRIVLNSQIWRSGGRGRIFLARLRRSVVLCSGVLQCGTISFSWGKKRTR